jgi:hypothetical protein
MLITDPGLHKLRLPLLGVAWLRSPGERAWVSCILPINRRAGWSKQLMPSFLNLFIKKLTEIRPGHGFMQFLQYFASYMYIVA